MYDGEAGNTRGFPGLCDPYCRDLYTACQDVILLVDDTPELSQSVSEGADSFCSYSSIPDQDYCFPDLETNSVIQDSISPDARTGDGCLCLQEFADNLMNPVIFAAVPDDSGRILVGEQRGVVHVFYHNRTRLPDPFMDIRSLVLTSTGGGDERGLLSLAYHPKFEQNRKFYLYFSTRIGGIHHGKVSEFKFSDADVNSVDSSYERVIIEVRQPYNNHNGGPVELLTQLDNKFCDQGRAQGGGGVRGILPTPPPWAADLKKIRKFPGTPIFF